MDLPIDEIADDIGRYQIVLAIASATVATPFVLIGDLIGNLVDQIPFVQR
ncbi:MAG: hypothetical protein ACTH1D_01025 [Mycobacteriaceae bacterium]